jgi:hypothetical protein
MKEKDLGWKKLPSIIIVYGLRINQLPVALTNKTYKTTLYTIAAWSGEILKLS